MEEVRAAVDAFILACGEVLNTANRNQHPTALRKLFLAREQLRQKCEELSLRLGAAQQKLQLADAERFAEAERLAATATAIKPEHPEHHPEQPEQPLGLDSLPPAWADQFLNLGGDSTADLPDSSDRTPELPTFDFGSLDIDIRF